MSGNTGSQTDFFNFGAILEKIGIHEEAKILTDAKEMFTQIILWYLVSSFLAHLVAALIALAFLKRHRYARWYFALIVIMGLVGPATSGVVTSGLIAILYRFGGWVMPPYFPLCFGMGQTLCVIFLSFLQFPATL